MSNKMHSDLFHKINEIEKEYNDSSQDKFVKWLLLYDHNGITNVKKINKFIETINKCLETTSYKINDDNQFKDELASLVYRLSNVK
tara:strand:+ start:730 stop:987 length:258 start_codon:yes stop_codon:yes gene_type:complete